MAPPKTSRSSIIIEERAMTTTRDLPPVHPGEHLREDFMKPLGLSAYKLAKDIDVPVSRVQALVSERRGITGDTALRLARHFSTSPEFWLNLQRDYDLETAEIAVASRSPPAFIHGRRNTRTCSY
jgi:addiction module HigA family antidote